MKQTEIYESAADWNVARKGLNIKELFSCNATCWSGLFKINSRLSHKEHPASMQELNQFRAGTDMFHHPSH